MKSSRIMATSSLRSKFEKHLTCSVCLEQLKDPKVLPCLHSFCHDCIVKLAKNGKSKNMACPECRKVVQVRFDELFMVQNQTVLFYCFKPFQIITVDYRVVMTNNQSIQYVSAKQSTHAIPPEVIITNNKNVYCTCMH